MKISQVYLRHIISEVLALPEKSGEPETTVIDHYNDLDMFFNNELLKALKSSGFFERALEKIDTSFPGLSRFERVNARIKLSEQLMVGLGMFIDNLLDGSAFEDA